MVIKLDFREINKKVKNSTAKPRDASLQIYQRNIEILSVYIKGWQTLYEDYDLSSFCHNPTPKMNDRVINGLFHTKRAKYLDVHANEKIIIL